MIRYGLWGPPFLCTGGWLMVGLDRYVPLVNGGGVGGYNLLVIPPPSRVPPLACRGDGVVGLGGGVGVADNVADAAP